jgi:DNA polymerase II small subunit
VLNNDYVDVIEKQACLVDWYEIDSARVHAEKERDDTLYQSQLQTFRQSSLTTDLPNTPEQQVASVETELTNDSASFTMERTLDEIEDIGMDNLEPLLDGPDTVVTVVVSYTNIPKKYQPQDFAQFFLSRYRFLESLLRKRQELRSTLSIRHVLDKKDKENVAVIGLVDEIAETRNGNLILTLEDPTGKIKVLISKNKRDLFDQGRDLVVDEVIGIAGVSGDKIVFAETIVWPDIPQSNQIKKGPEEEYIVFLSDIHVGSHLFLEEEFGKFLQWINGGVGNEEQKAMANAVKYVFIAGDLVDGVGIYPGQEEELSIPDIKGQYAEFSRLISQIPKNKQIIICPGNHDAVHLAEPQPAFYQKFSEGLFELPNVTLVTNPSLITVGKKEGFSGFDVLMYHGYSFDYYVANVPSIRLGGGYHRSDLIMKFLLKRRHLAPSFKSTPYYPNHDEDPLLIKTIPDFLITGHIHYSCVANYKGVTMISGSCWQAKTDFQEKLGHEPEPARVPIVNLKTRKIKVLRFS